jgi:dynein intermediate chain 2
MHAFSFQQVCTEPHFVVGTECFSTSTDGRVLWWDLRKISEPTDSLTLEWNGRKLGGMSLDYEPTMVCR